MLNSNTVNDMMRANRIWTFFWPGLAVVVVTLAAVLADDAACFFSAFFQIGLCRKKDIEKNAVLKCNFLQVVSDDDGAWNDQLANGKNQFKKTRKNTAWSNADICRFGRVGFEVDWNVFEINQNRVH